MQAPGRQRQRFPRVREELQVQLGLRGCLLELRLMHEQHEQLEVKQLAHLEERSEAAGGGGGGRARRGQRQVGEREQAGGGMMSE